MAVAVGACAACLWTPGASAWLRVLGAVGLLAALPGWGLQRWLLGAGPAGLLQRCAVGATAPWAVHGILATLLGAAGVGPHVAAATATALGIGAGLFGRSARHHERAASAAGRRELLAVALLVLLTVCIASCPPELSLRSDVYAHVAAVRACLEENRVFPRHEFYALQQTEGPDPRFGTAHAFDASLSALARVTPLELWTRLCGLLPLVWGLSTASLAVIACRTRRGRVLAAVLFLGCYGGTIYNPLRVAAYPQWVGLALVWTGLGLLLEAHRRDRRRATWAAAALLAGCGALHALSFLLGATLLAAAAITAPRARRAEWARALAVFAAIASPVMALRLALSHGNENPIHQLPWYPLQWRPGLFSVRPDYLLQWLFPMGLAALLLMPALWRRGAQAHAERWAVLAGAATLAWLAIPWLLTPSLSVLGFLPLRFILAVLFPLLWGLWADGGAVHGGAPARGARRFAATLALLVAAGSLALRLAAARTPAADAFVDEPQWIEITRALDTLPHGTAVVLSDPYTMLAVRACTSQRIVAVPDGRSSPRDAQALQRLRDTWSAMSPSTDAAGTDALLVRYGVTHVLLNRGFRQDLLGFEYAVALADLPAQRAKLAGNPQRYRLVREVGGFALYEVVRGAVTSEGPWRQACTRERPPRTTLAAPLHDGFELLEGAVEPGDPASGRPAVARLQLGYRGALPAPYREIVLRADATPSPVPAWLRPVGKPVRKLLELAQRRRTRARWTALPGDARCPTFLLQNGNVQDVDVPLPIPPSLSAGVYDVTVQVAGSSEFTALAPRDFLRDDDIYSGPVVGRLTVR